MRRLNLLRENRNLLIISVLAALLQLTGCRTATRTVAAAPPPPPPVMISVPPPTHPTEPEPEPEVAEAPVEPTPTPPPPKRPTRRRTAPAVPAQTTAPTTPPPAQVASTTQEPLTQLGQLTTGGEANNVTMMQQTEDLLRSQQRRLTQLPSTAASEHTEAIEQARLFLRQAEEAWKKLDVEGARTLATKAKVLLDEALS